MTEKNRNKKLILLDSHAILHRAYHALPDFASSKGEPTGGLYGLSTMLIKIISDLKPDYIAACYDLAGPTYRHEAYKEYKAGRKKADSELVSQMIRSRDIFTAFNIPIYEKPGFEADDMLGTIVEKLTKNNGVDIVIASGDMDTLQLVKDKKVQVYTLKKGISDTILYDEEGVFKRFGFHPDLLPDYKGLRGDPSDNIIGIKGIGEKTATTLIQKFGTIEEMYKTLKKSPKAFEEAGLTPRVIKLLEDGEEEALFSKMLATIRRDAPIEFKLPDATWSDSIEIKKVLDLFADLEFRTLGARVRQLLGIEASEGNLPGTSEAGNAESVSEIELKKTSIALWVLDSNISNPGLEDVLRFAKTDSFKKAQEIILGEIEKKGLKKVYVDIELPLIPIVEKMHERGIKVDTKYLKELSDTYHKKLNELEKEIWKLAGEEFNINSPKQLGVILFEKLGLKIKNHKKTGGGVKSTRESELEKMKDLHPVIAHILEHRELQKLLSTYIDTIPDLLKEDGRLHTHFMLTGTTTGRMSSNNPNLQNIPIKTELGRNIRKAFIAEKGYCLAEFDYSQVELRVAAFLSGDKKLIDIFKSGRDVHTEVAAEVFKVPSEKVDKEMRRKAKVINFGILYGMGVNALRQNLGTNREEAQKFYNEYFSTFAELAHYLNTVKADVERKGYTETFFGRRRYFEGINSRLPFIKAMAERMAINAPIQGTAADIIKIAMGKVETYIESNNLGKTTKLLLQVHDSLVFEVKKDALKEVTAEIKKIMETVVSPKEIQGVTLKANCAAGDSWGDMDDMK